MQAHVAARSVLLRMQLAKRQLHSRGIPFYVSFLVGDGARTMPCCLTTLFPSHRTELPFIAYTQARATCALRPAHRTLRWTRCEPASGMRPCGASTGATTRRPGGRSSSAASPRWRTATGAPNDPDTRHNSQPGAEEELLTPVGTYPKPSAIAGLHWSWLMCDAHALAGAIRSRLFEPPRRSPMPLWRWWSRLTGGGGGGFGGASSVLPPDYVWVFDYDIGWVGDIASFIQAFDAIPSDLLVAKDDGRALDRTDGRGKSLYSQLPVRNYLRDGDVHSALLAPVRYSRRMLSATRQLLSAGNLAFCETRGPSLCRQHPSWCSMSDMLSLRPDLFNSNFSCCRSHSERYARERALFWGATPKASRPPCQLLHRVKPDNRTGQTNRLRPVRLAPNRSRHRSSTNRSRRRAQHAAARVHRSRTIRGRVDSCQLARPPTDAITVEARECEARPGASQRAGWGQEREKLSQLAAHWLSPFAAGVREADLEPVLGPNRSHCHLKSPSRTCPLLVVRGGALFVHVPFKSRLFLEPLPSCRRTGSDSPAGAAMRRLEVVLRLIRGALARQRSPLPDFAVRLCVDELCHGMFERRPLPWLTMVSCASFPSLPAVQWNVRDPPLSAWDATLAALAARGPEADAAWPCRAAKAVFRGEAAEPYSTNHRWTSNHTLTRLQIFRRKWREQVASRLVVRFRHAAPQTGVARPSTHVPPRPQGRLALVWQHCERPAQLDVFVSGLQGARPAVGKLLRRESAEYNSCLARLGVGKSAADKALSVAEQARRFRYVVNVEGVGGWSDQLKRLLLSRAALIKQDSGVTEWFEPLLRPWEHYLPVASDLGNISAGVLWLRSHDAEARRMARAASEAAGRFLSTAAMAAYMEALVSGYARLYRDAAAVPALLARLPESEVVGFECGGPAGAWDCSFVHRPSGERVETVLAAANRSGSLRGERSTGWC